MSTVLDEDDDDVDWKAVIDLLREGKTAEIPCQKEREYVRRSTQVVKRAENRGMTVEVLRGEGVLRVEPRTGASRSADRDTSAGAKSREEIQLERHRRREVRRAKRIAEPGGDG